MTSASRFGKSLKRLFRHVKRCKCPFEEHVILYLSFQKKQVIFEMEICNDNYGRIKNDNING